MSPRGHGRQPPSPGAGRENQGGCSGILCGLFKGPEDQPTAPSQSRDHEGSELGLCWDVLASVCCWGALVGKGRMEKESGGSLQPKNILRAVITDRDTHWVLTAYRPFTALAHRRLPTPQGGRCSHTHFTDVETEAQRTGKTCPSLHLGKQGSGQALPLSPSRAKVHFYIEKTCPSYEQCN